MTDSAPFVEDADHHPFWGTPPNLAVCEDWLTTVFIRKQDVERDLSVANAGGEMRDEQGYPVAAAQAAQWRDAKLRKLNKITRRYRWLSDWARAERRRLGLAGKPRGLRPECASVDAMHAAARRFGLLERLYDALRGWLDCDTDEDADEAADAAWGTLMDAVDAVEGQGA